jgi:hypothetical protein
MGNNAMTKQPIKTFYLTFEDISKLRSTAPFSNMTEESQQILEEYLQTAFCGMNRMEKKLLGTRLNRARDLLSLEEQYALWPRLKKEIENMLSIEIASPLPEHPSEP